MSASTFFSVAAGILLNASLVGAKTVMSLAEFSESTRPACLTAVTRVDSSGLPEAAVATGTWAIACEAALVGRRRSAPRHSRRRSRSSSCRLGDDGAMLGAALVVAGAAAGRRRSLESLLPQAASEIEKIAAAARAVSFVAAHGSFLHHRDFHP